MKSEIIKSKPINGGSLELVEFTDDFGRIIKYEIAFGRNSTGTFEKIEEFEDKNKAIKYFDDQN